MMCATIVRAAACLPGQYQKGRGPLPAVVLNGSVITDVRAEDDLVRQSPPPPQACGKSGFECLTAALRWGPCI